MMSGRHENPRQPELFPQRLVTAKAKKLDLLARLEEELAAIYAWDDDAVWIEIADQILVMLRQAPPYADLRLDALAAVCASIISAAPTPSEHETRFREALAVSLKATRAGLRTLSGANVVGANVIDFRTGQLLSFYGRGAGRRAKFDALNIRAFQLNIRAGDLDDRERELDGREDAVTNFLEELEQRPGLETEVRRLRAIWPF